MHCRFRSPSFLTWVAIVAISQERGTVAKELCDEQLLLFRDGQGLKKFCPKTNESIPFLFSDGQYSSDRIAYSSRDGGKLAIISEAYLIMFLQRSPSSLTFSQSISAPLPKGIDPLKPSEVYTPNYIDINWMTETAYLAYGSHGIVAYDLNTFNYAKVFKNDRPVYELSVVTYPTGGLLLWMQAGSICRSFLDGMEVKTVTEVGSYGSHAVDRKTLLVYWTDRDRLEILRCDMDGNNRRVLNLSPLERPHKLTVLNNIMYYQEKFYNSMLRKDATVLIRTDVEQETKQLVYNATDVSYLKILPDVMDTDDIEGFNGNPCAENSCFHMCVQSGQKTHACLCPDGYVLRRESGNCTAESILVSTAKGISKIPLLEQNPLPEGKFPSVNATNPLHVQCDNARHRIYWVEQDAKAIRIMDADLEHPEKGHRGVYKWNRVSIRYPAEELQAFALDWITSNLYVVFHNHHRILVCSSKYTDTVRNMTDNNGCAELFWNQVASSVGGLALDPNQGVMYWTHPDSNNPAIVSGGMDGTELKILKNSGLRHPTSIAVHPIPSSPESHVYWVDSFLKRIEFIVLKGVYGQGFLQFPQYKNLVPHRIAIAKENIYVVGSYGNRTSGIIYDKALLPHNDTNKGAVRMFNVHSLADGLSQVSGLSIYDDKSQMRERRTTACEMGHPCEGICLLSGEDSYRCVCPIGFEPHGFNRSSCRELELPVVIYGAINVTTVVKNGTSTTLASVLGTAWPVAYDPVRTEIIWLRGFTCDSYAGPGSCTPEHWNIRLSIYRQSIVDGKVNVLTATEAVTHGVDLGVQPFSCEYDWAGDNVYYVLKDKGVLIVGRNGDFSQVLVAKEDSKFRKVSLDPSTGWMYWLYEDTANPENTGIWRGGMDGSQMKLITQIPNAKAEHDLVVDYSCKSIFWVEPTAVVGTVSEEEEDWEREILFRNTDRVGPLAAGTASEEVQHWEILRSDIDGKNVRKVIGLQEEPVRIHVVGDRLFWTSSSGNRVTSCHKETLNNLMTHELPNLSEDRELLIIVSPDPLSAQSGRRHPCRAGRLCSHVCAPTPAGYMRCLCPPTHNISSNGWTCECVHPQFCDMDDGGSSRLAPVDPTGQATLGAVCPDNYYPCAGICLEVSQVCNGIPNCPDYSDEGEGCNEACGVNHGCDTCIPSPKGPVCVCPPGQGLDEDKKRCFLLRTEGGLWKNVAIVAGVAGLVLTVVITLVTFQYQHTRRKLRNLTDQEIEEFLRGDPAGASTAPDGLDRALNLPYTHVISPHDITRTTEKVLGSGEFGVVHPGTYNSEPVAIKSFKRSVEIDEFKAVLVELKIMAYLGDHEFIVKFIGAEISEIAKRKLMIVTELSPDGDLLHCLWKVASEGTLNGSGLNRYDNVNSGNHAGVTTHMFYKWCEQVASGMEYLAQKQIVHGDLAARNVLLFKDNKVAKITDFGMSKKLYGCSAYQKKRQCKLPWAWAAVELLTAMEFSEGSDVWAFGVTVWEILSLGQTPYKGTTLSHEFIESLKGGNRLAKPQLATDQIYQVLMECWNIERSKRPSFSQLRQIFGEMSMGEISETFGCTGLGQGENASGAEYISVV